MSTGQKNTMSVFLVNLFGSGYAGLGFICYNKGAMRKIYIREG